MSTPRTAKSPEEASLTTVEAAEVLSVCPNTVKRWIVKGEIPAYTTPGGHYRIPREGFREFLGRLGLKPTERE